VRRARARGAERRAVPARGRYLDVGVRPADAGARGAAAGDVDGRAGAGPRVRGVDAADVLGVRAGAVRDVRVGRVSADARGADGGGRAAAADGVPADAGDDGG